MTADPVDLDMSDGMAAEKASDGIDSVDSAADSGELTTTEAKSLLYPSRRGCWLDA